MYISYVYILFLHSNVHKRLENCHVHRKRTSIPLISQYLNL